ncbi:MAG: ATP-binding protein [Rhodospirillales bacterium]
MKLLPDTLAGRTIVILVIGLGLFHLWSMWIYRIGTHNLLGPAGETGQAERMVSVLQALEGLRPDERERTAHGLGTGDLEVHWTAVSPLADDHSAEGQRVSVLRERQRQLAPEIGEDRLRFGFTDGTGRDHHVLLTAVRLTDGSWVTFGSNAFADASSSEHDVLGSLTAMALGILIVSVLLVRSLTAPLRALASAADRIGTDLSGHAATETGPREIRQVAKAFNGMQARIRRLVDDRTQTLAAVSHDLKTPITRLRLRVEFVSEPDVRRMIDRDLDEMERMIDQTLAFLRGATGEESRTIDLGSVLRTICDQATDAGHRVILAGQERAVLRCKPLAVKRAFSNLIDNAIKYGGARTRVSLADGSRDLVVTVDDEGPGIPANEQSRVFDPFYRIEGSRSRETGGTGLGLTFARTVARAHGGDVTLQNRQGGGLRVVVSLPKAGIGG